MAPARFEPALNPATVGGELPITEYLQLAAATGYRWVELDSRQAPQLLALGAAPAARLLQAQGLRIASFFLPVNWRADEESFQQQLEPFAALLAFFAALGADRCCTYLLPNQPTLPQESRRRIGGRFQRLDQMLASHGVHFGLEFLGPSHFLSDPGYTFLYWMRDMLAFAESISANVGILVDSLHWHCQGADRAALAAVPKGRIVYAHIDDAPPGPRAAQRDDDRRLPGEGVIDLVGFIQSLAAAGYAGPIGIEIDGPYLRADSPERAARRARSAWDELLARPELLA